MCSLPRFLQRHRKQMQQSLGLLQCHARPRCGLVRRRCQKSIYVDVVWHRGGLQPRCCADGLPQQVPAHGRPEISPKTRPITRSFTRPPASSQRSSTETRTDGGSAAKHRIWIAQRTSAPSHCTRHAMNLHLARGISSSHHRGSTRAIFWGARAWRHERHPAPP